MSFFKYLLKNQLWLLIGFILVCVGFAIAWKIQGAEAVEFRVMAYIVGGMVVVFLIGNYIKWRQL